MTESESTITPQTGRNFSPRLCSIVLVVALLAAFWVIAAVGARQAAHDERVWGLLDPLIGFISRSGPQSLHLLLVNDVSIGWLVTAVGAALMLAGLLTSRLRAAPLVPLAVGVSLATWGQVALSHDRAQLGAWLYAGAIVCSLILGIWCPLTRLDGVLRRDASATQQGLTAGRECALVFSLTMVALFMRVYALTELPSGFDLEIVWGMIQSRTLYGLRNAFLGGFLGSAPGMVHMVTQTILFKLFGVSIYTIRLSAVVWGVAAVPLLYWLVRRIAGVVPAVVATLLFLTAPEQLYWSRTENAFFAPIAVLALITAHLGLWMVERFSLPAVLAAALWMPFCRYFYLPGMIMVGYPIALCTHALVCVRGAWRKAWYVVPVLAGGLVLWIFSISIAFWYVNGGPWRFINPALAYGAPAWRKQGAFNQATVPELIRLQTVSVAKNLGLVAEGLAYIEQFPSHWYGRYTEGRGSALNVGLVVPLALGLGYLVGQFYAPRSAVLLVWIVLGVLPACLSDQATVRRMTLLFPAVHIAAGVMLVAIVRIVRVRARPWLARITSVLIGVAVAGIVWSNMVSHFAVSIGPFALAQYARFAKPLFQECDAVFTDFDAGIRGGMLLDSLDQFIESPICYQYIGPQDWLDVALHARCDFADQVYAATVPPARLRSLQAAYDPRRVCYLLGEFPSRQEHIELLRGLYPSAAVREYRDRDQTVKLVAIMVDASARAQVHSPALSVRSGTTPEEAMETGFLAGVHLTRTTTTRPAPPVDGGLKVEGGIVVEHEGWYHFDLAPQCAGAELIVDGHHFPASNPQPMLAGVHAFQIDVSNPGACKRPLQVLVDSDGQRTPVPLPGRLFVNPAAVSVRQAQATPVVTYPGYGDAKVFARLRGSPADLGVDAQGTVSVLVRGDGWEVQRFNPDGQEETRWRLNETPLVLNPDLGPMVVGADGTTVILIGGTVVVFDRDGKRIGTWDNPLLSVPGEVALWRDNRVLIAVPQLNSIAVFTLDGKLVGELRGAVDQPRTFADPKGLTVSPAGDILVLQYDGQAVLFRNPGPEWNPTFVRSFPVDFSISAVQPRGSVFDGERMLIADIWKPTPLVYRADGKRMLAATPQRDLSRKGFGMIAAFQATPDRLYVLDRSQNTIWSLAR